VLCSIFSSLMQLLSQHMRNDLRSPPPALDLERRLGRPELRAETARFLLKQVPILRSHHPGWIHQAQVACFLVATTILSVKSAFAQDVFGWLENPKQAKLVQITRNNVVMPYDPKLGFQRCDSVSLLPRSKELVAVSMVDGSRFVLRPNQTPSSIKCDLAAGVPHQLLNFLPDLFKKTLDRRAAIATTQGFGDCAKDFTVPLLPAQKAISAQLVAGRSSLFITWVGSASSVDVTLSPGDGAAGAVAEAAVASVSSERRHAFEIKAPFTSVGHYHLRLEDACRNIIYNDIQVVDGKKRPSVPSDLKQSPVPEPYATLFYADYLLHLDNGRWGLEALQMVNALRDSDPVLKDDPSVKRWIGWWANEPSSGEQ
jgi:hypothetical protein